MNARVFLSINEVELSIYRFLTSGSKKNEKQPQPVELGSTDSLVVGAFNALVSYHCFNYTSIRGRLGKRIPRPRREGYWMRESVFSTPQPDLDWTKGTDQLVPWPIEPVGLMSRSVQCFGLENLSFSILFFSNT